MEYWKNENPSPIFFGLHQKFIGTDEVLFRDYPFGEPHDSSSPTARLCR